MQQLIRAWASRLGAGLGLLLLPTLGPAQCPAISGAPGAASARSALTSTCRMGIYQVALGSLTNSPAAPASLDLGALPTGLYLVRLTNAQGTPALRHVVRQ